jgi:phenylacetate-CoA ligase
MAMYPLTAQRDFYNNYRSPSIMYGKLYRNVLLPLFDGVIKKRGTIAYWQAAEKTQWLSREKIEALQLESLKSILQHAADTCPYYTEAWRGKGLEKGLDPRQMNSLKDFQRWPLLLRASVRDNRMTMRSTVKTELLTKATGGSSGEPLHFDLDNGTNERRVAMTYRGYSWAGAGPGSKQLYIWGTSIGGAGLKHWKTNLHNRFDRRLILSAFEFTPERMYEHLARMNAYKADVIVAYTNPLYEFARFLQKESLVPAAPKAIVVGAEKLHDFQRQLIEKIFRAPVFETYGSREFMLIGAECDRHAGLHLSMDNLLVEILNDDGTSTPDGEEGNVVITDLFNYGMPFIRYVTGDRAIAGFEMCACGRGLPLLKKVVGRQLDTLDTPDGRKIPGEFFSHLLMNYENVRRFQVVQDKPEKITLRMVIDGVLTDALREKMLGEIRLCIGNEVDLQVELVDEMPLTRAGKLKVVVRSG